MNPYVSLVDRTAHVYARMKKILFFHSTRHSTVRIGRVVVRASVRPKVPTRRARLFVLNRRE